MWGQRNPGGFEGPDPGIAALQDVAETLLGVPIDHYVLIDMVGFVELVDAMGGVTVTNQAVFTAPLYDTKSGEYEMITFEPGRQHLDGDFALAYARSRTGTNDYVRMGRQRCVISGLVEEASPVSLLTRLPRLLNVIEKYMTTDIPYNDLPYLFNFAPKVSSDRTTVVGFDVEYRSGEFTSLGLPKPDVNKIQDVVRQVFDGTWPEGTVDLEPASEACG
jgi:LCP family protein required for cell wall assembly